MGSSVIFERICKTSISYQCSVAGARAQGADVRAGAVIKFTAPAPDPFYFIKDLKKFIENSHSCISPRKKLLKSKKVVFKVSNKTICD